VYGAIIAVRNVAFDTGIFRCRYVGVPVIAVGNMTAGGTGKTPVVELLVRLLRQRGLIPGVISRGYGRTGRGVVVVADRERVYADAETGGDEPVQIARKFPGVPVVVGERRVDAAVTAVRRCGVQIIVSDDGFQHRWLHRDCDLVVVDGAKDIAAEPMLPAGLRREPMRALLRAHVVALTGCRDGGEVAARGNAMRRWFSGPIISIERSFGALEEPHSGERVSVERLRGAACFAFSGIGNPSRFAADLVRAGARVVGERKFRDHHRFTHADLREIMASARDARADVLVTTEKDIMRMRADRSAMDLLRGGMPVWVPLLEVRAMPADSLEAVLTVVISGVH
jgi:tetraacyldisaccharide 4'-kinase